MASNTTVPLLTRLIAAAVNVSQKSGRILREVKKSGELNVQEKGYNDFVTKADFLSQLNIIKSLEKQFPKLKFCGEEGDLKEEYNDLELSLNETVLKEARILPDVYNSIREEDLIVWVDPLDGTKEYTMDYEMAHEVTVLIGVAWNGRPIAGVVNQPFFKFHNESNLYLDRILWGIVGLGGFDLTKGKISVTQNTTELPTIVTTRSHITELIQKNLSLIPSKKIINSGGAGYKALTLIDSKADYYIYPRNGTKRWDTCAPEALIRSVGGCMTDIFGNEYSYSKSEDFIEENYYGIVFSLAKDNSNICSYFNQELKDSIEMEAEKVRQKYKK